MIGPHQRAGRGIPVEQIKTGLMIMVLEYTPYALPFIFATVISVVTAVYVWPNDRSGVGISLAAMAMVMAVWAAGYATELMAADLADKLVWAKRQYVGMTFGPFLWMIFALILIYPKVNWQKLRWLAFVPLTNTLLAFTNDWHSFIWQDAQIVAYPGFSVLQFSYAIGHWLFYAVNLLFSVIGAAILLYGLWKKRSLARHQQVALLVGLLAPWVSQLLFHLRLTPLPDLDFTPAAFSLTAVAFAIAARGHTLPNVAGLARQRLMHELPTGFIAVSVQGFVADINQTAAHIIGVPIKEALGQQAAVLLAPWPHLCPFVVSEAPTAGLLTIGQGVGQQAYMAQFRPLTAGPRQLFAGQIITLQATGESPLTPPPFPTPAAPQEPTTEPLQPPTTRYSIVQPIVNFFFPQPLEQVVVAIGESPRFNQLLEQAFTSTIRFAFFFFFLGLLSVASYLSATDSGVIYPFAIAIVLTGLLAVARRIPLVYRGWGFVFTLYFAALVELANYGYSIEAFIFFITIAVVATLIQGARGGVLTLVANMAILTLFGWQIAAGQYHPLSLPSGTTPVPPNADYARAALSVFTTSTTIILAAVFTLMRGVNLAWREESQAQNLLRQERDALDRRVVERTRQLQASEANLRSFIQASPAIVLQVDPEHRVLFAHIPGMSEAALQPALGQPVLAITPPQSHADIQQALMKVFAEQETVQYEGPGIDPISSQSRTYLVNVAPVLSNGQVTSAIMLSHDVTNRIQARQELIEINKQLDQFAYVISHDLKAPLRAIANLSTWIEEDLGDNLPPETAENMTLLRQRVEFMRRMIDGVLAYSRAGRQTSSLEWINLTAVVRQVISLLDCTPAFTITIVDTLPAIQGERIKLEQLFSNLIGNSIKYHDRPDGRIEISCTEQTTVWEFAVADDGPGIDPAYHDNLFDLFHTVEANKQADSTGIGLAVVRKIIEERGGRIWVESTPGAGATFRFTWPKEEAAAV